MASGGSITPLGSRAWCSRGEERNALPRAGAAALPPDQRRRPRSQPDALSRWPKAHRTRDGGREPRAGEHAWEVVYTASIGRASPWPLLATVVSATSLQRSAEQRSPMDPRERRQRCARGFRHRRWRRRRRVPTDALSRPVASAARGAGGCALPVAQSSVAATARLHPAAAPLASATVAMWRAPSARRNDADLGTPSEQRRVRHESFRNDICASSGDAGRYFSKSAELARTWPNPGCCKH